MGLFQNPLHFARSVDQRFWEFSPETKTPPRKIFGSRVRAVVLKFGMSLLREVLSSLDRRPVQTRANLAAYGGEFYQIGDEEWCDTATESYRRMGPDQWVASESLPAMAQPGMNTGEGESPERSVPVFTGRCGFESYWQGVALENEEHEFVFAHVPDVLP